MTTDNTAVIQQLEREVELLRDKLNAETKARKDAQIIGQDLSRQFERYGLVISAALQGKRHPKEPDNDGRLDAVRAMADENKALRCQVERLRADRIAAATEHAGQKEPAGYLNPHVNSEEECFSYTKDEGFYPVFFQPPAPVVPEGWKLVPVDPTTGMEVAGMKAALSKTRWRNVWSSMINATPEPPNDR